MENRDERLNKVIGFIERNEYDEAIQMCNAALNEEPDSYFLLMLISCYVDQNKLALAEEYIEKLDDFDWEVNDSNLKDQCLYSYYLRKCQQTWTGYEELDDGGHYYYPENLQQIEDAEYYLSLADELNVDDEDQINYRNMLGELIENVSSSLENPQKEFTGYDKEVGEKLEEIFSLWSAISTEDGMEFRNPANKNEIKLSEKILSSINIKKCKEKEIVDRYNELKEVVIATKENYPNYGRKIIASLVFSSLIVIALFIINLLQDYGNGATDYNPDYWRVIKNTQLHFDGFVDTPEEEKIKGSKIRVGEVVTPIARIGSYWLQVETEKGEIGFLHYKELEGSKHATIEKTTQLLKNKADINSTDSLQADTKVEVLGYQKKKDKERNPFYARVRSSNGKTGLVPNYRLDFEFIDNIPKISQTFKYPTTYSTFEKNVQGKNLESVQKHYGPPTSLLKQKNGFTAYFRHVEILKNNEKFKGVFLSLSADKTVEKIEENRKRKLKLIDKLPLSDLIRKYELHSINRSSYYQSGKDILDYVDFFKDSHWALKILGFIIKIIVWFIFIFIFLSIPRLFIAPINYLIVYTKMLNNGLVVFLSFLLWAFISYLSLLWLGILIDGFVLPLILIIPVFLFWQNSFNQSILYNRCSNCHLMNSAEDKGSTYLGQSKQVTWGTYDVYKGSTTSGNTTTKHYERRSQKTVETFDNYLDHRRCISCGHEWDIKRKQSRGSQTKKY